MEEQQQYIQPEAPSETKIGSMFTSLSNDKVIPAFQKALGDIESAVKDSTNPHLKNKYASLAACVTAIKPALATNSLGMSQAPTLSGDLKLISVDTIVFHSSGQYLRWEFSMPLEFAPKPQEVGKTVTYVRRYALAGFGLITDDDDDGNSGSGVNGSNQQRNSPPPPPIPPQPKTTKKAVKEEAAPQHQPVQQQQSQPVTQPSDGSETVEQRITRLLNESNPRTTATLEMVLKFLNNCEILQAGDAVTIRFLDMYATDRQSSTKFAQKWKSTGQSLEDCLDEADKLGVANLPWIQVSK